MQMQVIDDYSTLEEVIIALAHVVPDQHNEFTLAGDANGFHNKDDVWDKQKMIGQQREFINVLESYGVTIKYAKRLPGSPHQIYTRDVGFVYGKRFFFNLNRQLKVRQMEYSKVRDLFNGLERVEIKSGKLEGGDVIVDRDIVYIGISDRTCMDAIQELSKHIPVKSLYLGDNVMHLDTRMTILPNRDLLIYPDAFQEDDLQYLRSKFDFIEVTREEADTLATNVFVINPTTIVSHSLHTRIHQQLLNRGYRVEVIDYSEPITLLGSFRCTTLPVGRKIM